MFGPDVIAKLSDAFNSLCVRPSAEFTGDKIDLFEYFQGHVSIKEHHLGVLRPAHFCHASSKRRLRRSKNFGSLIRERGGKRFLHCLMIVLVVL